MTYFEQILRQMLTNVFKVQLEALFGPLSPKARGRLESIPTKELLSFGRFVVTVSSLKQLGLED